MASNLGYPTPNGTEGIVCVTITTDDVTKDPLKVKACIIRNKDQTFTGPEYLLLLPDIKCLAKEIKEAEFYHFRKKKALPLKLDGDFEDHFKHQCLPCDFKDEALPQRRCFRKSFRKKSTTETVNNYLKKYCTLNIEQAKRGQLCKKEKSLFGLKDGGPNKRAEFLKLNMSKGKVSFDGRECLHRRGPLFHGYKIGRDKYDVKVVGSYYVVDDDEISIHLFVEEDNKQSPDEKSKSSVRVSGEIDQHQSLQDGLQRNQYLSQNEPDIQQGQSDLQQGQEPMEQFQRADPQNDLEQLMKEQEQLMKEQHQSQIQQHLDVEERNYISLTLLLTRVGMVKIRQFFINEWNSLGGFAPWIDCPQNGADLLTMFTPLTYERPKVMSGDSKTWDLSILVKVLLGSRPPLVPKTSVHLVHGLKCLKETRNRLSHTVNGRIESSEFMKLYNDVCSALTLFGASPKDFKEVGEVLPQPWKELSTIVKHIASQDRDILRGIEIVNDRLDQVEGKVDRVEKGQQELQKTAEELKQSQSDQLQQQDAILQGQSGLREDIEELRKDQQKGQEKLLIEIKKRRHKLTKSISSNEDVELYSGNLKEAIKKETDFLPGGPHQSRLKTDDFFTNLDFYHGKQKSLKKCQRRKPKEDQRDATPMTKISEVFVGKNDDNPKLILISGEAGIGKTLFSYKILREWSTNCISMPNVKFTYLITFRQLNLLGKETLTLRKLLNLSPLLGTTTMIDKTLMNYIIQHPEQLFVVLDGFDEYQDYIKLIGDSHSKYENNVKIKMPVPVLISKLIQKKILRDSVIMITSRPGEVNELYFDRYVQISGFSEPQIIEFVEKYFNSKPDEEKKMAVDKVKGIPQYTLFGYVPLRCFFMCSLIEREIENKFTKESTVPITVTEFYFKVIRCLESSNKEIRKLEDKEEQRLAVEKTLDNFAKIAAKLNEENRYTFKQKDLKKLNLTGDEMSYLKASALIFRHPVASDSTYPQTTFEYEFTHTTIQEFLVARHLVSMDVVAVPSHVTDMICIFLSGLLGLDKKNNHDKFMMEILDCVSKRDMKGEWKRRVKLLRCLYEYGQEKEFTRQQLTRNSDNRYWYDNNGWIVLDDVTDTDCGAMGMLVELTATAISSPPRGLYINESSLTRSGLNDLLPSLKQACNITTLEMWFCQLDDNCADCLSEFLPKTMLTSLHLPCNNITDTGVNYLVKNLPSNLTVLHLAHNKISDTGASCIVNNLPSKLTKLDLSYNQVTDGCRKNIEQFCKFSHPHDLDIDI